MDRGAQRRGEGAQLGQQLAGQRLLGGRGGAVGRRFGKRHPPELAALTDIDASVAAAALEQDLESLPAERVKRVGDEERSKRLAGRRRCLR